MGSHMVLVVKQTGPRFPWERASERHARGWSLKWEEQAIVHVAMPWAGFLDRVKWRVS